MKSFMILFVVLNFLILGINAQGGEVIVFNWPGPLEVPVNQTVFIMPPNSVLVVFANASNDRLLQIGEGVNATFNCSVIINQLSDMVVTNITASWSVRKFDTANIPMGDPQPIDGSGDTYDVFGTDNRLLSITSPVQTSIAGEGESGVYTCEACGTMFAVGGNPPQVCLDSSTTLQIVADPPVIITTPGEEGPSSEFVITFNIGNDYCIRRPPVGTTVTGLDILCFHNPSIVIPKDPPPLATWSRNGDTIDTTGNLFDLTSSEAEDQLGDNGLLSIFELTPVAPYVGLYMCNLTTIHGQDSATTRIFDSDLTASAAITGQPEGGCSRFGISQVSTTVCAAIGEEVIITCSAPGGFNLSGPGGLLSQESTLTLSSVSSSDGGVYTCRSGPPCNDEMSFTITTFVGGPPTIVNTSEIINETTASAIHSIGTDVICISDINDPARIRILCGHDINNKVDAVPTATWTFPSIQAETASQLSDSPLRFGMDTLLTIDNDGNPITQLSRLQGTYTCNLTNTQGFDISSIKIDVFPNIVSTKGGFIFIPSEATVTIGNSTCQFHGGEENAPRNQIACLARRGTFETSWTYNGEPQPSFSRMTRIRNIGPGVYTCTKRSNCGTISETTTILGIPEIPDPSGPPPTDGPGVVFEIGQTVCVDPNQSGDEVILRCPKPTMFTDPDFVYVSWSKVGDANFSSTESDLRIPRSDASSAGVYICELSSGGEPDDQKCGRSTSNSTVAFQSSLSADSGFVSGSPNSFGNVLTIGSDTCAPPDGESLRIRCETTPTIPVSWTLDGNPVSGNELIDVSTTGTYTCAGTDGCGNALTASSDIIPVNNVVISSMIVGRNNNGCDRFNNAPSSASVCPTTGEMVVIQCRSSTGTYEISFGGNSLSTNQDLTLSPFADVDAGTYTCTTASNQCGIPSDSLEIFAGGLPPSISTPMTDGSPPPFMNISIGENVCLPFGESVNIRCVASSGSEPITYAWRKEPNQAVINTANTITVNEVGEYNCTATNSIGSASASSRVIEDIDVVFELTSTSQPSRCSDLKNPPMNTDLCFFIGDSVTLSCNSRQSMAPGTIQPGGEVRTKVISDLRESDTTFSCSISNDCDNETSNLIFLVQEPARVNRMSPLPPSTDTEKNIGAGRPDEPVRIQDNATVRLFCPYTGIDEPTTRWVIVNRDRTTTDVVADPPNIVITNENNTLILEIQSFNENLEGTYRCITGNNAGDDDGDVVLRFEPPEPGQWMATPWSRCEPDCHRGIRMREITCVGVNTRLLLPDNRCTETKPTTTEQCLNSGPCFLDPLWVPLAWSECTQDCGGGYRSRKLMCQIPRTQEVVEDSRCDQLVRPVSFEYCNTHPCCTGDDYPNFCSLIAGTSLCKQDVFKRACCWTCR